MPLLFSLTQCGLSDLKAGEVCQKQAEAVSEKPATSRLFNVWNNPVPSKNLPDSLAIPGVSGIPLSDGVQRHLISSDDEVGGQVGGQDGLQGEINE
ncbi:hypothetical protein [Pseudomonas sp. AMR01]|uniref:hypothetical protein n=1 Tax=Pseudomonas sp. AMR01 TaxID=3064904 RepID=UPI0035BF5EE3